MLPSLKITLRCDPAIWFNYSFKTSVEIIVLTNVSFCTPTAFGITEYILGVGSTRIVKRVDIRRNSRNVCSKYASDTVAYTRLSETPRPR